MIDSSLLDRYEKLLLEKKEAQVQKLIAEKVDTVHRIKKVISLSHVDEETRNSLREIIEPKVTKIEYHRNHVDRPIGSNNKEESIFKQLKTHGTDTVTQSNPTKRTIQCSVCKKEKPLTSFQEVKRKKSSKNGGFVRTYVYTRPRRCNYCRKCKKGY